LKLTQNKKVIAELPDKIEKKIYCPMTKTQQSLYNEVLQRSKKVWKDFQRQKKDKEKRKKPKERAEDWIIDLDKLDETPLQSPKKFKKTVSIAVLLSNQLMEMRKVCLDTIDTEILLKMFHQKKMANHPLLFRSYYDDEKISMMAELLKECDPEYKKQPVADIKDVIYSLPYPVVVSKRNLTAFYS
jgi:SNF2 family DNA or RNA helicase